MTWVRIDDRYPHHRKLKAAGPLRALCIALDVTGKCHCAEYATDGFIADRDLPHILDVLPRNRQQPVLAKLVEVGRWHRDDAAGGYWVHDFLKYNPSAAQRLADAAAVAKRKEADRQRKAAARRGKAAVRNVSARKSAGSPLGQTPDTPAGLMSRKDNAVQKTNTERRRASPERSTILTAGEASSQVTGLRSQNVRNVSADSPENVRSSPVPKDGTAYKAGSPVPPDTPPPTVGAAADDGGPAPPATNSDRPAPPRLSAQLRAEHAARTLADPGVNGATPPPPPAIRADVDPAAFEAERRRQLDALKATTATETEPETNENASSSEQKASRE